MNLANKFKLSFFIVTIIPIFLLSSLAIYIMSSYIEKVEKKNQYDQIKRINTTIDYHYYEFENRIDNIFFDTNLQSILTDKHENIADKVNAYDYIDTLISSITLDINNSVSKDHNTEIKVNIYSNNKTLIPYRSYFHSLHTEYDERWVLNTLVSRQKQWHIIQDSNQEPSIKLSRQLVDFNTQELIGIASIEIPLSTILQIIESTANNVDEALAYLDTNGDVIVQTDNFSAELMTVVQTYSRSNLGEMVTYKVDNQQYLISSVPSDTTGWYLISALPLKFIKEGSKQIRLFTLFVAIIAVLISVSMSTYLSGLISSRLGSLMLKIRKVEENYYTPLESIEGHDEIGKLDHVFNNMINEIKHLIDTEYKSRIIRDSAKLDLLQEQINPHLLYNTLSTIGWQAKQSGNMAIFDITNSLIRFYRTSLNRGEVIIPVKQEIAMTLEYIDLIQYTYRLDFEKKIFIDEEVYQYHTIKLILQPIIENAIMHGIRYMEENALLQLSCRVNNNRIILTIEDNGNGMDEKTVQALLSTDLNSLDKGYGLSNVIKRLKLYYGDRHKVSIKSNLGIGTLISISLEAMDERTIKDYLEKRYLL